MVYTDWTFDGASWSNRAADFSLLPPSVTGPALHALLTGTTTPRQTCYPTNGTIQGISIQGINEGRLETWFAPRSVTSSSRRFAFGFRVLNATSASWDGYEARVNWTNSATSSTFLYNGSVIDSGANWPTTVTVDTYYRLRASWWKDGSDLAMSFDVDYNNGAGYVSILNTILDSGNATRNESSTNGIAWYLGTGGTSANLNLDDFRVYRL